MKNRSTPTSTATELPNMMPSNGAPAVSYTLNTNSSTLLRVESGSLLSRNSHILERSSTEPSDFSNLIDGHGRRFQIPDYSVNDIRKAIPKECFRRSPLRGFAYIGRDVMLIVTAFYLTHEAVSRYPSASPYLWPVYGFLTGLFATGLWVLAHECGHQAFSPSKTLNDTVGFILHSALLVPYFSWKISHGKHHKATGHMERDMVFVPRTREEHCKRFRISTEELHETVQDAPIYSAYIIVARLLFGWPVYLIANDTGHNYHERQPEGRGRGKTNGLFGGVSHFDPWSPLFEARDAKWILLSDFGVLCTAAVLCFIGSKFGFANLWRWYFVPYLWVNSWLVTITFLQHTDPSLPHYKAETWNFVRGAAATIDRDFGFIGRHLFHGIIETHVLHHYVSTIPFYHADKATEAIKPIMGKHYRSDTSGGSLGFITSLWKNTRRCQWVEPAEEAKGISANVLFFRNRNGIGQKTTEDRIESTRSRT
ncbi:oleate delta-12 desaturase [Xylariales sp. PMI_506]|nr:oleate delta-12 desaturase [Xylariales sp. PMI_506]